MSLFTEWISWNFEKIQTDQEAIQEELYGPYPDLGHLEKYLKNAWNIRDVEKIWDLYEKQPYEETAEGAAFSEKLSGDFLENVQGNTSDFG